MYTLGADIKPESVMAVMYAAKKYDVQPLVDRCRKFLKDGLDVENVCEILEQAVTFSEQQLVDDCIAVIKENAAEVVDTVGLLKVSQPVLRLLFEKGFVELDPLKCYEAAKKWALDHLKADKHIDPEKVRNVLGDVINEIRFSDMQLETFIENVAADSILPDSTKVAIIVALNKKRKPLQRVVHIERFNETRRDLNWNHYGLQDGISFTVSSPGLLTGVCLYLPKEDGETSGPLEILEGSNIVLTQIVTLKYTPGKQSRNESLSTEIPLQPDKIYSVRHRFQGKPTYRGKTPITKPCDQGFTVEFMDLKHGDSNNETCLERGQFPGLTIIVPYK